MPPVSGYTSPDISAPGAKFASLFAFHHKVLIQYYLIRQGFKYLIILEMLADIKPVTNGSLYVHTVSYTVAWVKLIN